MPKVLDLGCRTGSAIAAWQAAGDIVVGVDWENHGQQIIGDFTKEETWEIIDNVTPMWERYAMPYDFIWFSPDCSIFSLANMRWQRHFDENYQPLTERAQQEVEGIKFVIEKIEERKPILGWVMENPRALMRKMDFVKPLHRATVSYCQYGFNRRKATDLFGNLPLSFRPRFCRKGHSCHVRTPRYGFGSQLGTQGMEKTEAGIIPFKLSEAIRTAAIRSAGNTYPTLEDFPCQ